MDGEELAIQAAPDLSRPANRKDTTHTQTPHSVGKNKTSQKPRKARLPLNLIIPIIGATLGILLLLYPVVSTRLHNAAQQAAANSYTQNIKNSTPPRTNKSSNRQTSTTKN